VNTIEKLTSAGFAKVQGVFSKKEVEAIIQCVNTGDRSGNSVMRSQATYAIRRALLVISGLDELVWKNTLKDVVHHVLGARAFITKSIWFDKPPGGNWFVPYHQDISISVDRKTEVEGYSRWTTKHGVIGVVPPVGILENTLTLRIHLDDADNTNGALKVQRGTHRFGIIRDKAIGGEEVECGMRAGDVMLMRPLLLHSSMRSTSDKPRRVLHIEVNAGELVPPLRWAERQEIQGS
jgi:hypothetical protein